MVPTWNGIVGNYPHCDVRWFCSFLSFWVEQSLWEHKALSLFEGWNRNTLCAFWNRKNRKTGDGMTRFNPRVFCGACLVLAAVAYAAEVDFVCSVANSSSIVCADCNKFCTGCGITCNADGRITGMFVPAFLFPISFLIFLSSPLLETASGRVPRSRLSQRPLLT